jgi:hypothetical protein
VNYLDNNVKSSSRLRTMLAFADRRIEKVKDRSAAIEVANRLMDRFNEYKDANRQEGVTFGKEQAEVEVLGFDDGTWMYGFSVTLSDRGIGSGFGANNRLMPSKEKAVRAGVGQVLLYLLNENKRNDVQGKLKSDITRLLKEAKQFLQPKQKTLF